MTDDDEAPGWAAIDAALAERASATDALHWATGNLPDQG